jgi:hypothetical protein
MKQGNNASAESVRARILNESRKLGVAHDLLIRRYVFERFPRQNGQIGMARSHGAERRHGACGSHAHAIRPRSSMSASLIVQLPWI